MLREWLMRSRSQKTPRSHSRRRLPWQLYQRVIRNRMQQTVCQPRHQVDKTGLVLRRDHPDPGRAALLLGRRTALRCLVPQYSRSDKKAGRGRGEGRVSLRCCC